MNVYVLVTRLCPTICDPMDCRLSGSSVHGILQARILERIAISFCRGSSQLRLNPGLLHCRQILYHLSHQGSPSPMLILLFMMNFMMVWSMHIAPCWALISQIPGVRVTQAEASFCPLPEALPGCIPGLHPSHRIFRSTGKRLVGP